jgi:hypothetical protein
MDRLGARAAAVDGRSGWRWAVELTGFLPPWNLVKRCLLAHEPQPTGAAMLTDQRGRREWDGDQDSHDVLRGLVAALPLSLLLWGLVILAMEMLR